MAITTASSSRASSIAASTGEAAATSARSERDRVARAAAPGRGPRQAPGPTRIGQPRGATSQRSPRPSWRTAMPANPGGSRASRRLTPCPTTMSRTTWVWGGQASGAPVERRRHAGLLPRAAGLRAGEERRRAVAVGAGPGRRDGRRPAQRRAIRAGELPAQPVRHADAGGSGSSRPLGRRPARGLRHLAAETRSATRRRSPAWPPASSGSRCPTSSTRSRSTSRSPTSPGPAMARRL